MVLGEKLEKLENHNFEKISIKELIDIDHICIDDNCPHKDRINKYIKEIRNPYNFKLDDINIKIEFLEDSKKSFEEIISKIIISN